jgi:SAM-dependent methyltransferase
VIDRFKRAARHVVHRSITPHLDAQTDEIERRIAHATGGADSPTPDRVLLDFNERLHELRTIELRRLPIDGGVLLSAGCAGAWYFDWLDACAGPFDQHIGVELYSPRPDGLASNVTWVSESASSMPTIADSSVDVVFSGQNIEHLWVDDLVGFLLESNRVLDQGGWLVVDSPNRLAVEALGWTHPQHTIEITVEEAVRLFELAGFAPRVVRGLWNCRDQATGDWLPLAADIGDPREMLERSVGRRPVDDDFVWWIESERVDRPASAGELRAAVTDLYERHWQTRVNRAAGSTGERSADGSWSAPAGSTGLLYRTHAFPLFPGSFAVGASDAGLRVRLETLDGREIAGGLGEVTGTLDAAELGVFAELHADAPLPARVDRLGVTVSAPPLAMP